MTLKLRYPANVMECLLCRDRIKPSAPSPQLCPKHYADPSAALNEIHELVDTLNDHFTAIMKPQYDDRLTKVLVAAADLALPGLHHVKTEQHKAFLKRIELTVANDDEFAAIVCAWWNARQSSVDEMTLSVQVAWMPINERMRNER